MLFFKKFVNIYTKGDILEFFYNKVQNLPKLKICVSFFPWRNIEDYLKPFKK